MTKVAAALRLLLVTGGCGFFLPETASGTVVTVDLAGQCVNSCANLGLPDGGSVGGTIAFDDSFFTPDGFSGNEALTSYQFAFGTFGLSSSDVSDPGFSIGWGSAAGSIYNLFLEVFTSSDPGDPGPALILGAYADSFGNGFATNNGYRRAIPDCCEIGLGDAIAFSVAPVEVAPIPLPPSVLLLAAALAFISGFRRRALRGCRGESADTGSVASASQPRSGGAGSGITATPGRQMRDLLVAAEASIFRAV